MLKEILAYAAPRAILAISDEISWATIGYFVGVTASVIGNGCFLLRNCNKGY